VAAASEEQAKGIEQINIAVTQMNQVTQQNADSADESAGASKVAFLTTCSKSAASAGRKKAPQRSGVPARERTYTRPSHPAFTPQAQTEELESF
jgi:hypothetical protein